MATSARAPGGCYDLSGCLGSGRGFGGDPGSQPREEGKSASEEEEEEGAGALLISNHSTDSAPVSWTKDPSFASAW